MGEMMGASKIGMAMLSRYIKHRLGCGAKNGVSPYDLACKVLEMDGKRKPFGLKSKAWVERNLEHISAISRQYVSTKPYQPPPKPKKKAPAISPNVISNDLFLKTYEWRRLRMEALKKYGPKCMCCGATPATGAVMNVDHIKPRKLFPELALEISNLQILCHECNHGKGNWDQSDWRS
jgi:5-methylcytosine-specific restriction endonuclease McrA